VECELKNVHEITLSYFSLSYRVRPDLSGVEGVGERDIMLKLFHARSLAEEKAGKNPLISHQSD
jgi:hypothetical protein